jgi:hypothetical protein
MSASGGRGAAIFYGEDMTQPTDEVTQDQDRLDAEQGIEAETQAGPLTAEQVTAIVQAQLRPLMSDIRGVQSINDKAADAMRRDLTTAIEQKFGDLQSDMGRQSYLNSLDERERELVKPLLDEMDRRNPAPASAPVEPAAPQQAGTADQWEAVYTLVDNAGLQRNDPRIKYEVLVDASLTPAQQQAQFLRSVYGGAAVPAQRTTVPVPQDQTVNPPVETGNVGVGAITSLDSLQDALIGGHITTDQFREQAAAKGWSV